MQRSLRVLDGAVLLFDGVAGVEAQTETVWGQARRYGVPTIGFINKLDREGSDVAHTVSGVRSRLGAIPLLLQWPVGDGPTFAGAIDLLSMTYISNSGEHGETVMLTPISQAAFEHLQLPEPASDLRERASSARMDLVSGPS